MKDRDRVGDFMYLYLEEIEPGNGSDAPRFLIEASARSLEENGVSNFVPIIVESIGEDRYRVIANEFVYAVAETAGLEKVWCIIIDDVKKAEKVARILAREEIPRVNLSTASRDEIESALEYLKGKPSSPIKGINLAIATNRIHEAPRKYWQDLSQIPKLKCGITRGKKLDALKELFYLTPQPLPDVIDDPALLESFTAKDLKAMAKKRGINGYSKKKKDDLIKLLTATEH